METSTLTWQIVDIDPSNPRNPPAPVMTCRVKLNDCPSDFGNPESILTAIGNREVSCEGYGAYSMTKSASVNISCSGGTKTPIPWEGLIFDWSTVSNTFTEWKKRPVKRSRSLH